MNKMTKVILLGALTAGFAFLGCGVGNDTDNSLTAGSPAVPPGIGGSAPAFAAGGGSTSVSTGGSTSAVPATGGVTSISTGGSTSAVPGSGGSPPSVGGSAPVAFSAGAPPAAVGGGTVTIDPNVPSTSTPPATSNSGSGCAMSDGVSAGGALGGLVLLPVALALAALRRRRR